MNALPEVETVGRADIGVMVDQLGDLAKELPKATPGRVARLYQAARLPVIYSVDGETVSIGADPMSRDSTCVRGAT